MWQRSPLTVYLHLKYVVWTHSCNFNHSSSGIKEYCILWKSIAALFRPQIQVDSVPIETIHFR